MSLHVTPELRDEDTGIVNYEKQSEDKLEAARHEDDAAVYAQKGHAATDKYGRSLIHFDPAAEARLRRKIDWAICPIVALLYLFCFIDRNNIGNARLAGLEKDLGLKGYDFNEIVSIFFISYVLFEVPSNMACKWFGPGKWLPFLTLMFGLMSICFAFVRTKAQANGVRFLLGVFEAGMMPGIAYYMTRWYRRSELTFRLALYVVTAPLAGAFGGLLASAILRTPNIGSVHSWQKIFLIEGIITCGLGIISFFILTDRPSTARWLNEEEKAMAIARVKSERVGATEVLDKIDTKKIKAGIWNPNTLAMSWIFFLTNMTAGGVALFGPTIVAGIYPDYSTVRQQLMTVPPYILGAAGVLGFCYGSWKMDKRVVWIFALSFPVIIGYVILLATDAKNPSLSKARYAGIFILTLGVFPNGALTNSQISANTVSDTARSAGIATNVMLGGIGNVAISWAYIKTDGPQYRIGNGLNVASGITMAITAVVLVLWQNYDNRKREKVDVDAKLEGLSEEDVADLDWRHPSFRWRH